jgi:hypothetical protein
MIKSQKDGNTEVFDCSMTHLIRYFHLRYVTAPSPTLKLLLKCSQSDRVTYKPHVFSVCLFPFMQVCTNSFRIQLLSNHYAMSLTLMTTALLQGVGRTWSPCHHQLRLQIKTCYAPNAVTTYSWRSSSNPNGFRKHITGYCKTPQTYYERSTKLAESPS